MTPLASTKWWQRLLVQEGLDPSMEVFALVEGSGDGGGLVDAAELRIFQANLHARLGLHEGQGRVCRHFPSDLVRIAFNLILRQDAIDEPDLQRLLGADQLSGEEQFFDTRGAHQADEAHSIAKIDGMS